MDKKIIFSGAQPTGNLTVGNYFGALKNWVDLQNDYDCIFCVVDMHAITLYQEPAELRRNTLSTLALYLACGLDPEKCLLFVQSHVDAHACLSWILSCQTMFGELSRMTQFKDKSRKHAQNVNAGLFTYPVLMASDILLYQADLVPVGKDQMQHIELARNIAERFNHNYSDTFTVPEAYIPKQGAKIMSLTDPDKKMSKSDENPMSCVYLLESRDETIKKFRRAVTDSDNCVRFCAEKPGISNLMSIYACATGKTIKEVEREFSGVGYGDFKAAVGEAVCDCLSGVRSRYQELIGDKAYLEKILKDGAEQARYRSAKTLRKVYRKVGFYSPEAK